MITGSSTILFLNHATVLGGAERVTLMAMDGARSLGFEPILACPDAGLAPDAAHEAGFKVVPCEFAWMQHTLRPAALARYIYGVVRVGRKVETICREHNVRLLHAVSPVAALYAVRASKRLGLPLVLHVHDAQPPKRFRRLAIQYLSRRVSEFVCVSECVRSMVVSLGVPAGKTSVLYNAVNPRFLESPPLPTGEITGSGPHIGLFSQIAPWKGQKVFLEAASKLTSEYPDATFHIIGTLAHQGDHGYLDELRALAGQPPLKGRAILEGYRTDAAEWMVAMDVVVHASTEMEAFGLVIAEAMALGKPVVATRVGGPVEIIEDGVTGILVDPGDPDALAAAIRKALSEPEIGARAAKAVRKRFTPARFLSGLADVYGRWLPELR